MGPHSTTTLFLLVSVGKAYVRSIQRKERGLHRRLGSAEKQRFPPAAKSRELLDMGPGRVSFRADTAQNPAVTFFSRNQERIRRKQVFHSRLVRGLKYAAGCVPPGHGSRYALSAQQIGKQIATHAPLSNHLFVGNALKNIRMRMGMASDFMATALQVSQLVRIEKCAVSKQVRRNEKMTLPAAAVEFFRGVKRALAAIVERDKDVFSRSPEIQLRNDLGSVPAACNSIEMARECLTRLLISHCGRPLESRFGRVICYVVIQERGNFGLSLMHMAALSPYFPS